MPSLVMYQEGGMRMSSISGLPAPTFQNAGRQGQPGGLATHLAVALGGPGQVAHQPAEVIDGKVVLGDADELQVVGEEAADQRHPHVHVVGRGEGGLLLRVSGRTGRRSG